MLLEIPDGVGLGWPTVASCCCLAQYGGSLSDDFNPGAGTYILLSWVSYPGVKGTCGSTGKLGALHLIQSDLGISHRGAADGEVRGCGYGPETQPEGSMMHCRLWRSATLS